MSASASPLSTDAKYKIIVGITAEFATQLLGESIQFNSISLLHDQLGLHIVWQETKTA